MATGNYLSNPTEYHSWASMKARCSNSNDKRFAHYGGRGITVCDRWFRFENFLEDMGERPKGKTLDRIDNNKGYYKENCRWADFTTQLNNTSRNRYIKYKGKSKTLSQWIEYLGLKPSTIRQRYYVYKWDINKCFNF